jgi:signal transduction histidine kinase
LAMSALVNYTKITDTLKEKNRSKILQQTEKEIKHAQYEKDLADKEIKIVQKNSAIKLLGLGIAAALFIGLLFYFNQRKSKELNKKNINFLKKENEWITTNAALQAQLFERNRISREIHDELGSSLTSIALSTELLRSKMEGNTDEVDKIADTSSTMVDSLNEIIWSLNSGNDSVKSLIAYIRKMYFTFLEDSGIEHQFEASPITEDFPLSGSKRRAIYLTTKEALNNVVKHAKAKAVQLTVSIKENYLFIQLKDDGVGLENLNEFGNGLKNMKHNMESIAGSIQFKNENGTQITISYPLLTNITIG